MRCPGCGNEGTRVVDSRSVEDGSVIRRRRACGTCNHRYTTFERCEIQPIRVLKRSGEREPFEGAKIRSGLVSAAKGRPISDDVFDALIDAVEDEARMHGSEVSSEWVGLAVLDRLRSIDHVTCLRFASVYKGFTDIGDFEREVRLIKLETTP